MDLTKKNSDAISNSPNQDGALDLSAKPVNSQSGIGFDLRANMVSAENEQHTQGEHRQDISSSQDQNLDPKICSKVQLNIPHFERSQTVQPDIERESFEKVSAMSNTEPDSEKESIKEISVMSNNENVSVDTPSHALGEDVIGQNPVPTVAETGKELNSKPLCNIEEKSSSSSASNSSIVNDSANESSVELEVMSNTVQETVRDFSHEIAHGILKESKIVVEPMDQTDAFSNVVEITSDVPTPGTPINKVLERVASEIEFASTAGEDSNISFASETSRDEEPSDSNTPSQGTPKEVKKKPVKRRGDLSMLALNGSEMHDFGADKLYEYRWPQDREAGHKGDWYMLQEQVSDYLGVKSFKRKYPDLERRAIEPNERVYLREKGWVTEMQCDLGLTAIRSDVVHDLMSRDYPEKYKEFILVLKERRKLQAIEKQKELAAQKNDKAKLEALTQKSIRSAAEFNSMFNRERREERRAFFDIHTFEVQYPAKKFRVLGKESTKIGAYPVALIPGQFQDNYKRYSPEELRYLPINTAMYSSPRKPVNLYGELSPLSDDESQAESVSTEASDVSESLVGSGDEEMDSDIFREDDIEDDEDTGSQGPGKTKKKKVPTATLR